MLRLFMLSLLALGALRAAPMTVCLPTENRHLLTGQPERFYMYVDRTFEGTTSKPWEGGGFGFVRTPIRINGQVVLKQFHEGIDIAPIKRDKAGNPLDLISSIGDGTVVHVSPISGRSNYGKYVVVEHAWEDSLVYSLYAHLAEITCQVGDGVKAGGLLGRMGYTGAGINRTRAHLHLELGLMMSTRYDDWGQATGKGLNHHGNFNGMNFAGGDVARFFLDREKNPELKFSEFVAATPVYFKVAVPATGPLDLVRRYPWLLAASQPEAAEPAAPSSWVIDFSATGLPIRVAPSQTKVEAPIVTQVLPSAIPHRYLTRNLVTGEGNKASLTPGGRQLVDLLTDHFPAKAAPSPKP